MSGFNAIDLSKLAPPPIIRGVNYDALLDEMRAEVISHLPDMAPFLALESEPVTQLLRVCAYYRMLDRIEFNDRARGNLLALATGADLDHLAAFWGVERLVVQEGDDSVDPPILEILEDDEALRYRTQLSLEAHSTAGPRGSYIYWARSASGGVKDAQAESPAPGEVVVTVLSNVADGTPSAELLARVEEILTDEDVRPLTDHVTVRGAEIVSYQVEAVLTLYDGPDASAVLAAARSALDRFVEAQNHFGHDITLSGLYAALHQPGVQKVTITSPVSDIVIAPAQAAWCSPEHRSVSVGGRDV